jgi:hypothetical protein
MPSFLNKGIYVLVLLPMQMPTCAIVGISFDVTDWKKLKSGEVVLFDYPKK